MTPRDLHNTSREAIELLMSNDECLELCRELDLLISLATPREVLLAKKDEVEADLELCEN